MEKLRGSAYISIGSMGLVVLAGIGILLSPFIMALASWFGKMVRNINPTTAMHYRGEGPMMGAFAGQLISGIGIAIGIIVLILSAIQLTLGLLAWKRRDDLSRTTFLLAVGIAFAIISLPAGLTAWGLIQLAFPVLIIVGASLNKQQENELRAAYYASQPSVPPPTPVEEVQEVKEETPEKEA